MVFLCFFCFVFFAVVSLHDPFRGELGKNAVAKSVFDSVRLLTGPQESLCTCPARRRQSTAQRRLSAQVREGRLPLVFPLFAMVILTIGFALMWLVCHQGTMARWSCTLKAFAGGTKEPSCSVLRFVGAAGRVSGLGALCLPSWLWRLQGHIL